MAVGVDVELRGVTKRYPTNGHAITALSDVQLQVESGALVAVTGPSGSGKSTLLHVIGAMDGPDSGTVRVGCRNVTKLSRSEESDYRRTIGFVFQQFHLLPALTVLENVMAPLLPFRTPFDKPARARRLLAGVGLDGREMALPSNLAAGEQQRVAIARALINNPGLVLADEPTGNLDSGTSNEIMDLLLALRVQREMTLIIATHDPLVASRCNRIVRLEDGAVVDDLWVRRAASSTELLERIVRLSPGF
jgi:putative ABC transport system ATP-binding protein